TIGAQFINKGSKTATFTGVCSFLYILDITLIIQGLSKRRVYKKCTFYTYACMEKYSLYSKNML
ncbi:hypothetical protein, partial [Priestia megaterium]|uniref:hypothetical protein n=1 Tax=Priestia megaterium TaxID=1404 RepID=UPI001C554F6C